MGALRRWGERVCVYYHSHCFYREGVDTSLVTVGPTKVLNGLGGNIGISGKSLNEVNLSNNTIS